MEKTGNDENVHIKTPMQTPASSTPRSKRLGERSRSLLGEDSQQNEAPPSVVKLKGRLVDFEQRNKEHYTKNQLSNNCPGDTQQSVSKADSADSNFSQPIFPEPSVSPVPTASPVVPSTPASPKTPYKFARDSTPCSTPVQSALRKFGQHKPKISKEEVQATNDGYASVQKLSKWLESKPYEETKTPSGPLRKGAKVITKSRVYEKDQNRLVLTDPALRDASVDVSDKKKWLESVFQKKDARQVTATTQQEEQEEFPSVSDVQFMFGGSAQAKAGVTKIKEVLEKRQKDIAKSADPKSNHKTKWEVAGSSHGQYKKKVLDERGLPPKKRLADLP